MIALPSFLAALDKPQAKPVSGEAETPESAENAGNDGFAALIAQLFQIIPAADGQGPEANLPADGQTGNPPSGKNLPVDGRDLAAATAGLAAEAAVGDVSPLPGSTGLMNSSATIISFQQAQTALATKRGDPLAQSATNAELTQTQTKENPVAQSTARADQIRLTISVAPADTAGLRGAAPQDTVAAAILPERAQSVRAASLEKDASSGERSGQSSAAESPAGAARALAGSESAKPFAMPVVAALETAAANRGDAMRMAGAAPVNAITSVENIERLVERLSVAREFDMSKPASLAVTHREFGALTVTFDNARNGLNVEIAAKDTDMQRALALAVAADRPALRTGEPLQQSLQQTSQATSAGSERGAASTGQGATSSGAGPEGDRSQDQRGRNLSSPPHDPLHAAAPSPGDDALYA